ncbi:SDR family oxidoreductase [Spirosoma radiotolerans]|uniref:NmrA family transcriptional regulator n=1 Tax=Spirosoma radiotolerans TaxID=1379870 RepID=A0A0E3V6A0_9BACT|nr:SDR family oxidoreductase [Spirosoma radiotolerans]AKD54847.1 NmrA family transcriptional regulator [Spirosoma radiotolerans]
MILVTGATGQFGAKAIDHLLQKGVNPSDIAALVRDAAKAKGLQEKGIGIRLGDYADHHSLVQAFKHVDKLLLVSSNDRQAVENRTAHHINVIKAAKEAKVKHLIYTSFVRKPGFKQSAIATFQQSHVDSETFLKNSGMAYTILQNGMYLEMIPVFSGTQVAEKGIIFFPAGDGKTSYVLREELAEAAAHVLTTAGHLNQVYPLTNTTSASFYDIAGELANVLGKDVSYQSPSVSEFESTLKSMDIPDSYIGMFTMWALALSQSTLDVVDPTLANFLGRKPTTVGQFLNQVYTKS